MTKQKNVDTKNKKDQKTKTNPRVIVNSCLLLLMAMVFGILTCRGLFWIRNFNIGATAMTISDAPSLCRYNETYEEKVNPQKTEFYMDEIYLCSLEHDENDNNVEVSDGKSYTMYLNNAITAASEFNSAQFKVVICVIGSIATIASLVGAVIYWNHNRARRG